MDELTFENPVLASKEPMFELRSPTGEVWKLFANGQAEGFPEGTRLTNRAAPLIHLLLGAQDRNAGQGVDDDGQDSVVPHVLPERLDASLVSRVREVMKLFLERCVIRFQFTVLSLKVNYLLAESVYLRKRNRQLKDRLFAVRGWHVQLPSVDGKPIAGGEHEPKAGAELEPGEAGRFGLDGVRNEPSNV